MEIGILLAYAFVIFAIYLFGYLFLVPIKMICKIIFNSLVGAIFIILANLIGSAFDFHIPINLLTAIIVGILGVPGALLLIILQWL